MPLPPYSDFQKNCIGIFDILIREESWTGNWSDRMNFLYSSLSQLMWETYPGSTFAQFCTAARRSGLSTINPVDFLDFMWSHLEYAELYIDPFDQSFRPRTSPADVNWENARIAAGRKVASLTVGDRKYKWGSGPGDSNPQYGYVTDLSDVVIPANNYDWLSRDAPYYRIVGDKNPVYPGELWTTTVSRTRPEIDPVIYIEETDDETQFVDETTQVVITFDTGELERQFSRVVKPSVTAPGRSYLRVTTRDYYDNGGNLERGLETIVTTELRPVADFIATPVSGSAPLTVTFTDQSTNTPTAWDWDMTNNGVTNRTTQNPSYTYTTPGTYSVKLTASNTAGSDQELKINYITVSAAAPVANFTLSASSGNPPLTVTFTDTSTGPPSTWEWDFTNDGIYDSTAQNPSHTYTGVGTYSVKLRVTNGLGSSTVTKTVTVVTAGMPVADFTASPTTVALGSPVTFTDTSFGTPTSWAWDFDNSGITDSTVQNPTYTYLSAGTKTVRLTVTNATGSDYEVKTAYITVTSGSGPSGNISIQQGTTSTNTPFVKGTVAAFYDPTRNWVRYGKVFSVTYLSDPTYKILHKAYYVPRIIPSNSSNQDYTNRNGLVALNEHTTSTSLTVETIYQRQGVTVIPAATGSYVTATSVTSLFKVGDRVSALIASLNVIVLGRVSAIRYINNDPSGTASEGYFRYYIKSWGSGPSGPILRTYSTDEEFVNVPGTTFSTFVSLGRIPTPPMKAIVISPIYIQGGGTAGSNTTDLLPKTYNIQLSASGGIPPYTWDVVDGSIMTGCNLSTSGLISGTATAAGTFQFKVRATDSDPEGPNEGTRVYLVSLEAYTGDQNAGGNLIGYDTGY